MCGPWCSSAEQMPMELPRDLPWRSLGYLHVGFQQRGVVGPDQVQALEFA